MPIPRMGIAALALAALRAQSLVDADDAADARKAFDSAGALRPLRCDVRPVQPEPGYRLQLQAGYRIQVPLSQFRGAGHELQVLLRITPDGRSPVYLSETYPLPDVPVTKLDGEFAGRFVVGEGNYGIEFLMKDDSGRGCQSKWKMQAKRTGSLRELRPTTPTLTVQETAASDAVPTVPKHSGAAIERLTILLHAASPAQGRIQLNAEDVERLTGSLASILVQLPARSVRVVVFSLERRAMLWEKDEIVPSDLEDIAELLQKFQPGVVDFRVMQGGKATAEWMGSMLAKEAASERPPDALVVIGPSSLVHDPVPAQAPAKLPGTSLFYYLQYQGMPLRGGATGSWVAADSNPMAGRGPVGAGPAAAESIRTAQPGPDTINAFVRRWHGETLVLRSPQNLADALRRMNERIPKTSAAGDLRIMPPAPAAPQLSADAPAAPPASADASAGDDPTEVLVRLRDRVRAHAERVPNYTCVETVERERYEAPAGRAPASCDAVLARRKDPDAAGRLQLASRDRLRLDVAFADGSEIYSWAGASRFEEKELDEWLPAGAIGTGPFAASVLSIFQPQAADFTFEGETKDSGRRLLAFGFVVPRERSHYRVKARTEWVITGYSGTLLVDPSSSELVRMTVRSDELPAATEMCETGTVLDFSMVQLGAGDYLLPAKTRQRFIGRDGDESENTVTFAGCREYRGQSSIRFGAGPQGGASRTAAAEAFDGAAGLPVEVELTTPIRADEAAAGDRIEGRLVSAAGPAAAGAKVEGRLMCVETRFGAQRDVKIVLRWERVEVAGTMREWSLAPVRRPADVAPRHGGLNRRGTVIELPAPGEERYGVAHVSAEHPVLDAGTRMEWVTAR